jgi:hypothetical protein
VATLRKRGARWQVGRQKEAEIERGELLNTSRSLKAYSLAALLTRYESEVTSRKRGASSERYRLRTLKAAPIAGLPLDKLTPSVLARHRDERLLVVSGVRRSGANSSYYNIV